MGWIWLIGAIVCEVIGTTLLKVASDGGKYVVVCWIGVATFYVACFALIGGAMKHFPLGTVYAAWSGIGVSLLAVIGVVWFNDEINTAKVVSLGLIVAGIVGLNMSGVSN